MTKQQINELKNILINDKKEAETELKMMKSHGPQGSLLEWTEELTSYDNHPADIATETFEMEKNIALNDTQEKYLQEINNALIKIENGKYGICETCLKEIDYERLKAIPYAKECISCAKQNTFEENNIN